MFAAVQPVIESLQLFVQWLLLLLLLVFTLEKVLAPPVTHSGHMVCNKRTTGTGKSGLLTFPSQHTPIMCLVNIVYGRQGIVNQSKCVCVANAVNTEQVPVCDKTRRSVQK